MGHLPVDHPLDRIRDASTRGVDFNQGRRPSCQHVRIKAAEAQPPWGHIGFQYYTEQLTRQ